MSPPAKRAYYYRQKIKQRKATAEERAWLAEYERAQRNKVGRPRKTEGPPPLAVSSDSSEPAKARASESVFGEPLPPLHVDVPGPPPSGDTRPTDATASAASEARGDAANGRNGSAASEGGVPLGKAPVADDSVDFVVGTIAGLLMQAGALAREEHLPCFPDLFIVKAFVPACKRLLLKHSDVLHFDQESLDEMTVAGMTVVNGAQGGRAWWKRRQRELEKEKHENERSAGASAPEPSRPAADEPQPDARVAEPVNGSARAAPLVRTFPKPRNFFDSDYPEGAG
jgi:hypothetical protein